MQRPQRDFEETPAARPSAPRTPGDRAPRTSVVVARRAALGSAWLATVALAAIAGWFAARLIAPPGSGHEAAPADPLPVAEEIVPPEPEVAVEEEVVAEEAPPEEPVPRKPEPEKPAPRAAPVKPAPVEVVTIPEPEPEPEPVAPAVVVGEVYARVSALAASGDFEGARAQADVLLAEFGDYSGLTEAFRATGAADTRARLDALRVIQLAGLDEIGIELAREMKRSYGGTPEVLQAIRDWRVLKPNIAAFDSSIEEGVVVVRGRVGNPDIGAVRQVVVEVEALDAGGNVLATETTRVRPKSLGPGEAGSFSVRFGGTDPAAVLRTRATVVKWQSEVIE